MRYELTKDLETGNRTIDGEHRELLDAVNRLMDACGSGQGRAAFKSTADFLLDYVNKHFAHEEQLQRDNSYPGMAAHKAFHEQYKKTLRDIVLAIPPAGPGIADVAKINNHVGMLVNHIRIEDKKLAAFLKK